MKTQCFGSIGIYIEFLNEKRSISTPPVSLIVTGLGSVASVKKILFYDNDWEPIKNNFIENQGFMILDCPGFD
jgi:hypothetical protein